MTDPIWPETLPSAPLASGFMETLPDTTLRTQMDMGPAKTRQRTTAGIGKLSLGFLLTAGQVAVLRNFYQTTLSGGSLRFQITHPVTAENIYCRFLKPPAPAAVSPARFKVLLELEVLP